MLSWHWVYEMVESLGSESYALVSLIIINYISVVKPLNECSMKDDVKELLYFAVQKAITAHAMAMAIRDIVLTEEQRKLIPAKFEKYAMIEGDLLFQQLGIKLDISSLESQSEGPS